MTQTYAKPYISGFSMNLNDFVLKQVGVNNRNIPVKQYGKQYQQMSIEQTLYLGDRNVGTQSYVFGKTAQPATPSNSGLPTFKDVLPLDSVPVTTWLDAIGTVLDESIPEYSMTAAEGAAGGPTIYLRINRIEASIPWDKPEEQYIGVFISGYEDAAFTRQIEDLLIYASFATDEFVKRNAQFAGVTGELTDAGIQQVRTALTIFSLKDLLARPGVVDGIGAMGQAFFTTLKAKVYNFSDIDVPTIMNNFTLPTINS